MAFASFLFFVWPIHTNRICEASAAKPSLIPQKLVGHGELVRFTRHRQELFDRQQAPLGAIILLQEGPKPNQTPSAMSLARGRTLQKRTRR